MCRTGAGAAEHLSRHRPASGAALCAGDTDGSVAECTAGRRIRPDSWECVGQDYTATCMRERNQRLVMLADCCICYYRKSAGPSGTAQTIRMAQKKGIPVINLADMTEE